MSGRSQHGIKAMAPFRKSSSKSRSALEASTSLPAATNDLVAHGGEQAARLTEAAVTAAAPPALAAQKRSGRKAEVAGMPVPGDLPAAVPEPPVPQTTAPAAAAIEEPAAPVVEDAHAAASEMAAMTGVPEGAADTMPEPAIEEIDAAPVVEAAIQGVGAVTESGLSEAGRTIEHLGAETSQAMAAASDDARPAAKALDAINATVAEALRTNIEETMSHWAALMDVRSVPEAITLHTEHLQRRMQTFASQGRQFTALAQKLAVDAIGALRHSRGF